MYLFIYLFWCSTAKRWADLLTDWLHTLTHLHTHDAFKIHSTPSTHKNTHTHAQFNGKQFGGNNTILLVFIMILISSFYVPRDIFFIMSFHLNVCKAHIRIIYKKKLFVNVKTFLPHFFFSFSLLFSFRLVSYFVRLFLFDDILFFFFGLYHPQYSPAHRSQSCRERKKFGCFL